MRTTDVTPTPARPLGGFTGTCRGKFAHARETTPGSWQVKVYDPRNRLSGHDGWLTLGTGWTTLAEASAATGLS
jgi:hypothetical protein